MRTVNTVASDRKTRRPMQRVPHAPEHIDPELTPAPVPVDFDETMDLNEQVFALRDAVNKQVRQSNRDWGNRDTFERLDRIENSLGTLAKSATQSETILEEYVKPQLDHWRATTDAIARDLPKMLAALEGVTLTVQQIDRRLRDLEVRMETSAAKADAQHAALELRMAEAEANDRRYFLRLKEIEDKQLTAEATEKALAKTSRKSGGASGGVVAAIVSIGAAVAQYIAR